MVKAVNFEKQTKTLATKKISKKEWYYEISILAKPSTAYLTLMRNQRRIKHIL